MRASHLGLAVLVTACAAATACSGCFEEAPVAAAARPAPPPAPSPVAAPQPSPPGAEQVELLSTTGEVEGRAPGGEWKRLAPGERLHPDESIRTVGGATAILKLGDTARVELSPMSEFSVSEISRSIATVTLSEGRVAAVVNDSGGSTLRVEVRGNAAVAEANGGEFAVLTNGGGRMTVAATTGLVRLSSNRTTVEVAAGQQTFVEPNQPPAPPTAIPASLYLKVGKPASLLQRDKQTTIGGRATPGAVVSVNGVRVLSGKDGEFVATVPLAEGENTVTVRAVDVTGRTQSVDLPPIVVKDSIAGVRSRVLWTGEDAP